MFMHPEDLYWVVKRQHEELIRQMDAQRLASRVHSRRPRPWARRRHAAASALARCWGAVAGLFPGSQQQPVVTPAQEAGRPATPGMSATVPTPLHGASPIR